MKNEIIKDDYQVVVHCGNYEPYAAGYRDGIAIGENKAIEKFIEYLDNNAFELRHDEDYAIDKAISDMEKLEKIEQYLEDSCASDCTKCEHTDICDTYGIIQILRGGE